MLLSVLTAAGCSSEEVSTNDAESNTVSDTAYAEQNELSDDEKKSDDENEKDEVLVSNENYSIRLEQLGEGVYYAQVSGMKDESAQEEMNEWLKNLEYERYMEMQYSEQIYTASPVINYADEEILSLVQRANFYTKEEFESGILPEGGAVDTVLNYNMTTGEELRLSDITDTDKLAEKVYNNDGLTIIRGSDTELYDYYCINGTVDAIKEDFEDIMFYLDDEKNIILYLGLVQVIVEE